MFTKSQINTSEPNLLKELYDKGIKNWGLDKAEQVISKSPIEEVRNDQAKIFNSYTTLLNEYLSLEKKQRKIAMIYFAPKIEEDIIDPNLEEAWHKLFDYVRELKSRIYSPEKLFTKLDTLEKMASIETKEILVDFIRKVLDRLAHDDELESKACNVITKASYTYDSEFFKNAIKPNTLLRMLDEAFEKNRYPTYAISNNNEGEKQIAIVTVCNRL